ncbi:MAG: PQQ-like beta-propeller repeat protein [Acidobacteria bacterium]|nr:PQQ-like beta-propeller repeat protein [Acidobacteriota bacterium]
MGPILLVLLLATILDGENWPQWRGPSGSGVSAETGLPVEWSERNIAWKAPLRGLGVSSPIVWGERVFVTYQVGAGALRQGRHPTFVQSGDPVAAGEHPLGGARSEGIDAKITLVVAAFDRSTGKRLWEHPLDAEGELPPVHEKRNLATSSAVTDGARVYAWFSNGQTIALDMSGKLVWKRHLGRDYSGFNLDWGHASSPVLYRDRLLLLCYHGDAAYLLALDKLTGRQLWKVDRGNGLRSYSTPLVVETGQGAELIVNSTERVEAFDPLTGKPLWQFAESTRFAVPMPLYHGGVLYMSRGYRSGPYMALGPGGRGEISKEQLLWHAETGAPYVSSLVYHDGLLYMAGEMGIVSCVDANNGELVWRERLGGIYSASPVAADGKIYLLSETGDAIVLRAGRKLEVLARNTIGEQIIASPAISGRQLLIRTDRHLIAIRAGAQ